MQGGNSHIDSSYIHSLVERRSPAHDALAFIPGKKFCMEEAFLKRLAKQVLAIANKEGGRIIIGIKAQRHRARSLEPIELTESLADMLRDEIIARMRPLMTGLQITSLSTTVPMGVCIIDIPSPDGPYMLEDHRYYRYENHRSRLLEEEDVRHLYHQPLRTRLEIFSLYNTKGIPTLKNGRLQAMDFYPKVLIRNTGNTVEKNYKLELHLPAALHNEHKQLAHHFNRHENQYAVYTFPGKHALFQEEVSNVIEFGFTVHADNLQAFMKGSILLVLYYTSGKQIREFALRELFAYNNKALKTSDFNRPEELPL